VPHVHLSRPRARSVGRVVRLVAMDVFEGHRTLPGRLTAPAVAIGNFDGVHLGHQALLRAAIAAAARLGGRSVALTFHPHPSVLLAPRLAPPMITSRARKLELLAAAGVDVAVVEPFTPALGTLPAADCVDQIL